MTDNAGPPKQPRDALSALIVETSLNLIVQLGSTSPSYCAPLCVSVTLRTGQRRSLIILMTRRLCSPSSTSYLKQHNSLHPPHTPPLFLLISSDRRSTRYVWIQQPLRQSPIIVDRPCERLSAFDDVTMRMRSEDLLPRLPPSTARLIQHRHGS